MACKFRLSRFCNVERSDREYLRAPPPGRWIEGGNGYRREPRTRNVNSRHVPRSDELIWKFQSALRTNESRRRKISQAPLVLLSLLYHRGARVARRSSSRIGVAAPRRSSSTFYSLAAASASDLPKGEIFRFPPLRRVLRSYVCAAFLRTFGRFLRSNVSTGDRSCTPMALWLRAATTVGPY